MDINGFWQIIDEVHAKSGGDMDAKCELLQQTLEELADGELLDFDEHFQQRRVEAYRWDFWAVAYILNGGCSDDSFSDFCSTLISQGRRAFEAAQADPNTIIESDIDLEDPVYEGYQYVVGRVCDERKLTQRSVNWPDEPVGEPWDEDTVGELYPKVAEASLNWN